MTLNNDQISTVLLLIETSQLPEPELSEAWDLHNYIQKMKMNHPLCAPCATPDQCALSAVPCPAAGVLGTPFGVISTTGPVFSNIPEEFIPMNIQCDTPEKLAKFFKGPLPEVGQEVIQVCIGRSETHVNLAWMVKPSAGAATVHSWNSTDGGTSEPLKTGPSPDAPSTDDAPRANRSWVQL